jgi:hypothetical protein
MDATKERRLTMAFADNIRAKTQNLKIMRGELFFWGRTLRDDVDNIIVSRQLRHSPRIGKHWILGRNTYKLVPALVNQIGLDDMRDFDICPRPFTRTMALWEKFLQELKVPALVLVSP